MSPVQELLEQAVARERLVGAQVAVLHEGRSLTAQAGSRDAVEGTPVSPGTCFEIGSVTKPLVAAALLLAQDGGLVDVDAPVVAQVPEFRPVDASARSITPRHVLSHTSGLAGDFFPDTGSGPGAIAAFVELLAVQPLDVAPGTTVSYSNGAYVLAGRLLECATDLPFDEALRERLLTPAGARRIGTWSHPQHDDLADGHELDPDGDPRRSQRRFPRALTPAGGVLASARDLALLVGALTTGSGGTLPRWLVERSRERLAPLADRPGTDIGWGWAVSSSDGALLLAHDGGTFGSSSFVRVFPDADLVVVLLTNRADVGAAGRSLVNDVLEAVGHPPVRPPTPPAELPGAVRDPAAVLGAYRRTGGRVDVVVKDSGLWCTVTTDDEESGGTRVDGPLDRQPPGHWHVTSPQGPLPVVFLASERSGAQASCVVAGARAHTRVRSPT